MNSIKLLLISSFALIQYLLEAQLLQLKKVRPLYIGVLVLSTTSENRALFQQRFGIGIFTNGPKFAGPKNIH